MPAQLIMYEWFADKYGWTPDQVRELDLECYDWFPGIKSAQAEAMAQRQRVEEAKHRSAQRR